MEQFDIKNLLIDLGYKLTEDSKGWRSAAICREGDNPTSLLIYKDGSGYTDFVLNETGSLKNLIQKSITQPVDLWLKDRNLNLINLPKPETPKIKSPTIYPIDILNNLLQIHTYWEKRCISTETVRQFRGGVALKGKLKDRYVFPIFNVSGQIIGFTGRTLINSLIKHKHLSNTKDWAWPLYINHKIIREKSEIILVEGVGDVLTLFECGIKNCAALFGCELKLGLLNAILRINPKKIIIATNFDEHQVGQEAAIKIQNKLFKYFDHVSVQIKHPSGGKDLNEILMQYSGKEKIMAWYNNEK